MAKLKTKKSDNSERYYGSPGSSDLKEQVKELKKRTPEMVKPSLIKTSSPFKDIFPIYPEVLQKVQKNIHEAGYDMSQPVIVWKEQEVLIDGHTRLTAALNEELSEIPVIYVSLPDEHTAVQYVYSLQTDRRNLTDAERFSIVEGLLYNVEQKSINTGGRPRDSLNKKDIADLLTIGTVTAQKYINIIKRANEEIKQQVRSGDLTVNQADKMLRPEKPTPEPSQAPEQPRKPINTPQDNPQDPAAPQKPTMEDPAATIENIEKVYNQMDPNEAVEFLYGRIKVALDAVGDPEGRKHVIKETAKILKQLEKEG